MKLLVGYDAINRAIAQRVGLFLVGPRAEV